MPIPENIKKPLTVALVIIVLLLWGFSSNMILHTRPGNYDQTTMLKVGRYYKDPLTHRSHWQEYTFHLESDTISTPGMFSQKVVGTYEGTPGEGTVIATFVLNGQEKQYRFDFSDENSICLVDDQGNTAILEYTVK